MNNSQDTLPPCRRADDQRITRLVDDVVILKTQMIENTEVTKQVKDILTSFRMVALAAKWVAAVGAGILALYHGWQSVTGR